VYCVVGRLRRLGMGYLDDFGKKVALMESGEGWGG